MEGCYWIWYPGDFELYHAMVQNFSRVERGFGWPAFWKSEGWRNRIVLWREYHLTAPTVFRVQGRGAGFVRVNGEKHRFGESIHCSAGKTVVVIHLGRIEALPCAYVEGEVIRSDSGWMAEDYSASAVPAGSNSFYTRGEQDPAVWEYQQQEYRPVKQERCCDGTLYEFETELTAVLRISCPRERWKQLQVYCGESRAEALDTAHCYYSWQPDPETGECPRCALRFVYIPGEPVEIIAKHQYVDIPVRARFQSSDPLLNRIWAVAEHTFRLCSGIFFLDGVKRDKWIWSGDAYQCILVNRYLMADADIDRRTLLALRGNDPVTAHINTIADYSLLWLLGVKAHFDAYQDEDFLAMLYPKMKTLMDFCQSRTEEHGFLVGRERDWIFIDWADLDKDGPLGAEQMLLAGCWRAMAEVSQRLGHTKAAAEYEQQWISLRQSINQFYWDEEKGAYVDSFVSGRRHISRQTNLFALLFGAAGTEKGKRIFNNVIENGEVPPITTPYFQFFALDALGQAGQLDAVMERIRSYWGGMLSRGAATFWEEFDPDAPEETQYDMYGDKFGKSLCHAWSASPIYLISRYFVGLQLSESDETDFILTPRLEYFETLDCILPVGAQGHSVHLIWDGKMVTVETTCKRGVVQIGGKEYELLCGQMVSVTLK